MTQTKDVQNLSISSKEMLATMPGGEIIAKLYEQNGDIKEIADRELLNAVLNVPPHPSWVKENKFANNSLYLPIDKVEWLLRVLFKVYRVEILDSGQVFNSVFMNIRLHYLDPVSGEMVFQDGTGASEIQTKAKSSPADLANINNGAVERAFPIAKTNALKNACYALGTIFGSNLNRKDTINHKTDFELIDSSLSTDPLKSTVDEN